MSSLFNHQFFESPQRVSQSLSNNRCQNIFYKTVFEHFKEIKDIAVLLLASKSFQNSSVGANFLVNFVVDEKTIDLLESVLSPSSCFSMQFVPSLHIERFIKHSERVNRGMSKFVREMVQTKYLHLSLRSLTLDYVANDVVSFFFGSSGKPWPQLQELTLAHCGLKDPVVALITKNAVQLRKLNFSQTLGITDASIEHIATLVEIESLNLSGCYLISDVASIAKLSEITFLNLSGCSQITDQGLEHLSSLSRITSLNLTCCVKITDSGLESISKLSNISSLDLSGCFGISDFGLEHLAKLPSITNLTLTECTRITGVGLQELCALSSVTSLDLRGCDSITDAGIEQISNLRNMTKLDLLGCYDITDTGLDSLSKMRRVTSLNLASCMKITDAGLEHLSKLDSLTSLNLSWCGLCTATGKKKFKEALPKCNIVEVEY